MSPYEIIAVIFSVIGLVISLISIVKSHNAHKISQGQIELNIHQLINQTQKDVIDVSIALAENLPNNSQQTRAIIEQALNAAYERNLNAYEEACAKYLDNKVDKERFKKNFIVEITQLVQNKKFQSKFNPTTSSYKAILKVYNEWNDWEK